MGPANRPAFCRQVPLFYAKYPSKTFSRLAGLCDVKKKKRNSKRGSAIFDCIACILIVCSFRKRMLTVVQSCSPFRYRSYPCPGSIAMIAFFHPYRFCARSGSSWCCLRSLRTLSIHLSLGLPRRLFPPTFIVITCFATFVSSLLITWPYHERRFCVTYVVIGFTIASLLNFSFLILSFLVFP